MKKSKSPNRLTLAHAKQPYDPQARRERYLRTRQLKGRRTGEKVKPANSSRVGSAQQPAGRRKSSSGPSASVQARIAVLEKRLDRLRDLLAQRVEAAKARSGIETKAQKESKTEDKTSSSSKSGGGSKLTAKQKKEAAERSKDYYEKNKKSGQQELEDLQRQIKEIRAELRAAVENARNNTAKSAANGR